MHKLMPIGLVGVLAMMLPPAHGDEHLADIPPLPHPVSNNAVAQISRDDVQYLMSFMGLGPGKTHSDIVKTAMILDSRSGQWEAFPDVPVEQGRLASVAVGIRDGVLLLGGYTVAPDGHEVSTPEVFMVDPVGRTYQRRRDMPVPVDDTVALPYLDRYVYLVSGWHDDGNVSDTQLYDVLEDRWVEATGFPGTPVFGHAAGIVDDVMIVVGGVGVLGTVDGKRQFGAIDQAWQGRIDPADPRRIDWQALPMAEGTDGYRMAATGSEHLNAVIFAGGTERPYNFNGVGYDGLPASPSAAVFAWDLGAGQWIEPVPAQRSASMDHRGLLGLQDGRFVTLGGMTHDQRVTAEVIGFKWSGNSD